MKSRWNLFSGLLGNALEWYDFILYAYFAPIFADLFFPSQNPITALIATFSVFASGFFARPIGGYLLGLYGDRFGRRAALIISLIIMTTSTLCIAFLPTYKQIGMLAPFLLTLFRLLQGSAVGGELTSSATFLGEHANPNRRGLIGSLVLSTAFFGMLLGSAITTTSSSVFMNDFFLTLGWRIPYLLGALFGIAGIYFRTKKSVETPVFIEKQNSKTRIKFSYHKKPLILLFIFTSVLAVGNYTLIAYATSFLLKFKGFNYQNAMTINLISLFLLTFLIPLFGFLSDYIGRKRVLLIGLLGLTISSLPIFWLLNNGYLAALVAELILSFFLAPINAIVPVLLVELFPTHVRATASSIAYNSSQAIFGGTAPVFSLLLIEKTHQVLSPGIYLLLLAIIAIFSLRHLSETKKIKLNEMVELSLS